MSAPTMPSLSTSGAIPGLASSRLSAGDGVDIVVYGVPELSQKARLNSSGNVYLPLLNDVALAGLSLEEAQAKVEKLLMDGGFLKNPHVSISVVEYAHGISLLGEVNRPGVYPVSGERRLFDIFAAAGGLLPTAGSIVTITHRSKPETPETVVISRDPARSMDGNILVSPGDTVVVGKAGMVYVVGEVTAPSGVMMDNMKGFTVLKAIAMAHGTTRGAALDGTRVIRKTETGLVEIPVPLSKIMKAKAQDIELQQDDIVFVPNSAAKGVMRRSLETALGMVSAVTVIRTSR
ncbi:MAG TPA: polysaccharide biosynthesis/export family protein [Clostridia bacterium]|nr:polysaccharide biosynthesis/export family protein [Clostridia bacterium]